MGGVGAGWGVGGGLVGDGVEAIAHQPPSPTLKPTCTIPPPSINCMPRLDMPSRAHVAQEHISIRPLQNCPIVMVISA